ncbi:TonB-dependent receptor plug domain-containing protein [Sphingomonas swuensis]|uniref:TonB-dependent receptor plug domain-containing protein n=1 Tax=Sphingomonas swuensis TaxID=977800 RepID=UPI0031E3E693
MSVPAAAQTVPATGDAPPPVATPVNGKKVFTPADFARFAPRSALDMLGQVPGFRIQGTDSGSRGLGQATGNILLNGKRLSGKSADPVDALQSIPAENVTRIEIVDAAEVDVPGLTGQVANVIYEAKKLSGQFGYQPQFRAHYADPLLTRFDVSVSGASGPVEYTLSLKNDGSRSSAGGPTLIERGGNTLFETRDDVWRGNFDQPQVSAQFKLDGPGSSVGNLNLLGRHFRYRYDERSARDRVSGPDLLRRTSIRQKGENYEIGGDYEVALLGGRLKFIGLNRSSDEPFFQEVRTAFDDGSADSGNRFVQDGRSKELIGRAEYRWKMGRTDLQLSGEAAFNSLDSASRLYALNAAGDYEELLFPFGSGKVSEDRYEGLLTIGRPLSSKVTAQLVVGAERSTIIQEGPAGKERTFLRPKGSLNIAAQLTPRYNLNFKIIRRVGQLDFGDFLARVFLDNENANAGNPDLVPTQQWRFELEQARDLGRWGKTRLNLVASFAEDLIDIVPVGEDGETPGNIDKGRAFSIDWNSTIQLDPLGLKGAKVDFRALAQTSRVRDPLTGRNRLYSGQTVRLLELGFRHDIPRSDWAYGFNANYSRDALAYRLTEVGRQYEGPVWLSLFVENKDVAGLTMRAGINNILNARSRWDRTVYAGRRNVAPIDFVETRDRLIGPILSFSARGTF